MELIDFKVCQLLLTNYLLCVCTVNGNCRRLFCSVINNTCGSLIIKTFSWQVPLVLYSDDRKMCCVTVSNDKTEPPWFMFQFIAAWNWCPLLLLVIVTLTFLNTQFDTMLIHNYFIIMQALTHYAWNKGALSCTLEQCINGLSNQNLVDPLSGLDYWTVLVIWTGCTAFIMFVSVEKECVHVQMCVQSSWMNVCPLVWSDCVFEWVCIWVSCELVNK